MDCKLTIKQQKFCDHYLKTGNATEAYKVAGYKPKNDNVAGVQSCLLLRNPKIHNYIEGINKKTEDETVMSVLELMQMWSSIARDPEVDYKHRLKASEHAAKAKGMFLDKVQVSGDPDKPLNIETKEITLKEMLKNEPPKNRRNIINSLINTIEQAEAD